MPNEINLTTIQNAIQALATIKSKLYDDDEKINITPQVVSIENHFGEPGSTEKFISMLYEANLPLDVVKTSSK